jgi:hypothetical protein
MIKFKNNKADVDTWCGQEIQPTEYYEIQSSELSKWQNDSKVLSDIGSADGIINNGTDDVTDVATAINLLKDNAPKRVVTAFEENDKRLKCARSEASFVDNVCTASIEVPSGGRWIAGGYAFTDHFCAGDIIETCRIIDVNNIIGYGANTVLACYEDSDAATEKQGWYFEPNHSDTGYLEIEPIGGYAFIPEGLFLVTSIRKMEASTASKAYINFWWGKVE